MTASVSAARSATWFRPVIRSPKRLTQVGGILDSFLSAQSIGGVAKDAAQKLLSAESDADIFAATSQLTLAQQSLQASLAVSAKTFGISLLNLPAS